MIAYFDSSVLLTILLNQERYGEAHSLWNNADFCLSSFLLRIETSISLCRTHKISSHKHDDSWLAEKIDELNEMLKNIHCKSIDKSIEQIIIKNKKLAGCKSLDAIHLATALYFKENAKEQNIILCSFDKNMLKVAKEFGFETN
jgi:predicted nucleic acid-binding protein